MNRTTFFNALAGVALVAALGVMVAKTRSVNFEAHGEIVGLLRQIKQVDAEWNVDVLRSKTGLNNDYDPVANPLALVESLETALRSKAGAFWSGHDESGARIRPLLDAYKSTMDRKIALIDRFKSQNSILRNSSRYLPLAAADALAGLDAASPATRAAVAQDVDEVLTHTLIYANAPDAAVAARTQDALARLQRLVTQLPPDAADRVDGFTAHAETVLRQEQLGARTLAELAALPSAQAIDGIADAHAAEHEKLMVAQQRWRTGLVGYAALLLLALGFAGWRLVRSYRLLHRTHVELQRTNDQLKESQVVLVQSEKMAALGQMVAGIAHEINTPLAYVKGTFEVLKEQVTPVADLASNSCRFAQILRVPHRERDRAQLSTVARGFDVATRKVAESRIMDEVGQLLADGIHGIEQIAEIVTNLKNFSRLDRAKVTEFSVEEGLESTLLLARNLLKNKVEIVKDFAAGVPRIQCSPSQINQVFLNIVTNAVHAMPEGRSTPGVITLRTCVEGDDMVRVEIQDNGSGIPADVLPKIFDPFFTTKPIGQGTGMGLSISFKIVQEHGGRILVDTEPDAGTVFSILLPVRSRQPEPLMSTGALLAA